MRRSLDTSLDITKATGSNGSKKTTILINNATKELNKHLNSMVTCMTWYKLRMISFTMFHPKWHTEP